MGFYDTPQTHASLTWEHGSFPRHTMQSTLTGVSPMPCIGEMERFQPLPFLGAAPRCPTMARRHFTRAAFRISVLPKLRHP